MTRGGISLEEEEETMENEADEVRTSVGIGGGGYFGTKLLRFCHLPAGGKAGGEWRSGRWCKKEWFRVVDGVTGDEH